jgi:cytidine deaminase
MGSASQEWQLVDEGEGEAGIRLATAMSNQLEDDLRRVLSLARAQARATKRKGTGPSKPRQRHRHDQHLAGSRGDRSTLLTARMQGLSAIYGLATNSRHLGDCGSKSVLLHQHKDDPEEEEEVLQQRVDARRTLYRRHFAGALVDSSGRTRDKEHVLEAAAREARSSRAMGVGIGAALLTESQTIYSAGAVESGAVELCAERAAVLKMLLSGVNSPRPVVLAMAICSEQQDMLPFPCGSCRELLADCGDFPVFLVNALGEEEETRSSALFPRARHSELTQILAQSKPCKSSQRRAKSQPSADQTPLEVKDWTTEHVLRWLDEDVELPQYRDVFERNNVDGCTLVLLEGSDLQLLLGVTQPLHRSKLLTHVDRLRDRELLARGLDYTQLEDYLAVLDIDRVSAVAQLKTTFDRLDADHDGFLDFSQVKQALSRLRCTLPASGSSTVEASPQAVERLLHSEALFGKEAAASGQVSFPAFARAFAKLATQPAETSAVTQGAFAVHAFGPRLPVLDLPSLRKCFDCHAAEASAVDEPALVRLLKELGQTDAQSTELACRWLDAQDDGEEPSEMMNFAQFVARYAQLLDAAAAEGAEASSIARLQVLFASFEPAPSARRKPRSVVPRALSTLFPTVPSDEVNVWSASFWPSKAPDGQQRNRQTATLSLAEFTLACLEFAAEVHARELEAAAIKRSLRNDALVHRSRVVHLHSSGHVRMCPQPPDSATPPGAAASPSKASVSPNSQQSGNPHRQRAGREGKDQDSDEDDSSRQRQRRGRREQQVDRAFDRFARRHGATVEDDDGKADSDQEDASCMLNAVEAAQAALELGAALSREQVLRYLEREDLGRIRRRDVSRTAFHRLMKRLDANQSFPRDLLLDVKENPKREASASPRKERTASRSPRHRAYTSRPDYDEFLRQKLAQTNGTQWEKDVDALRRKQQRREERRTRKPHKKRRHRGRKSDSNDDGKRDSEDEAKDASSSDSTASEGSTRSRHRRRVSRSRSRSRHTSRRRRSRARSRSSEASTDTETSSTESTRSSSQRRGRNRGFQPGARVASMVHGRGTVERVFRDYFVADVHFDSGRHVRNVELSGLRVLDPEDELLRGAATPGFSVGSRVSVAHKGTKTRRQGKIILCRTDGSFDVLVNEFGAAQTLKRMARSALTPASVKPSSYREGARVMVRQRTEYLRGRVCTCRADGSCDVKLARPPQNTIQRVSPELLAPDDGEEGDSDGDLDEKEPPATTASKPTKHDSDDEFEPEFARGDRVEARFGGQAAYYPGTVERVHPNGSCDISYDDGDEEERVAAHLIRALPSKAAARKPAPSSRKKKASDDGYESDLFDSD